MIYLDIAIILVMIILWVLIKDFINYIKLLSILLMTSGYLMLIWGFIIRQIIKNKVKVIGINKISNIVFKTIINKGLILLLIGCLLLIGYVFIIVYKLYIKKVLVNNC